jgi:hypothetical protein
MIAVSRVDAILDALDHHHWNPSTSLWKKTEVKFSRDKWYSGLKHKF